jgi:hypothetical protein
MAIVPHLFAAFQVIGDGTATTISFRLDDSRVAIWGANNAKVDTNQAQLAMITRVTTPQLLGLAIVYNPATLTVTATFTTPPIGLIPVPILLNLYYG